MSKDKEGVKGHKEEVKQTLFSKDFYETKGDKTFPKNRLVCNLVSYSGQYLDKDKNYQDYKGEKIVIINTKLILKNDNVETKKKVIYLAGEPVAVDDEQKISFNPEHFKEFLENVINEIE